MKTLLRNTIAGTLIFLAPTAYAQDQTWRVKAGDTLLDIARQTYGTSTQWRRICDANKDVLDNCDLIEIGTELRLPGLAATAEPAAAEPDVPKPTVTEPDTPQAMVETAPETGLSAPNLAIGADDTTGAAWFETAMQSGLNITRIDAAGSAATYRVQGVATASFASQFYDTRQSYTAIGDTEAFTGSATFEVLDDPLGNVQNLRIVVAERTDGRTTGARYSPSVIGTEGPKLSQLKYTPEASADEVRIGVLISGFAAGDIIDLTFKVSDLSLVAEGAAE